MPMRRPGPRTVASRAYLNGVLTAIAGVLAIQLLTGRPGGLPELAVASTALGAPPPADDLEEATDPSGRVSAADQRKTMIAELRQMSKRIASIESMLIKGVNVKVVSMPASGEQPANSRGGK